MSTYSAKASDIRREWFIIDAENVVLGRLATEVASILRGKHKAEYTPHADTGDNIIIINAEKIKVTGNKRDAKMYHRHTGFPGGLKTVPLGKVQEKHPERIIELAVKGMLPKNPLGRAMYRKLKVYAGNAHPHEAQQPQPLSIKEKEYIG